jgi:hypothetical protein
MEALWKPWCLVIGGPGKFAHVSSGPDALALPQRQARVWRGRGRVSLVLSDNVELGDGCDRIAYPSERVKRAYLGHGALDVS